MNVLTFAVVVALVATVGVLMWGIGSMAHGGSYDRKHSEELMFTRIGVQLIAFALIMLALFISFV